MEPATANKQSTVAEAVALAVAVIEHLNHPLPRSFIDAESAPPPTAPTVPAFKSKKLVADAGKAVVVRSS